MLLTLIPLLSPQGWDYVFLIATPAVVYFVNYDDDLPVALRAITWVALALIAFSLWFAGATVGSVARQRGNRGRV